MSKKIVLYVILIISVLVLLFLIFGNNLFKEKEMIVDNGAVFPDDDSDVVDQEVPVDQTPDDLDSNDAIVPDPENNQDQTQIPFEDDRFYVDEDGNLVNLNESSFCQEGDFECYVFSVINCTPSQIQFTSSSLYPLDLIYNVEIIKNYKIIGYNSQDLCEIETNYSKISFEKSDLTREDYVNYFMESYYLSENAVDYGYIDDILEKRSSITNNDLLILDNVFYEFIPKKSTCFFDEDTRNNLISEFYDLHNNNFISYSLFNQERLEETYINCQGDLYN